MSRWTLQIIVGLSLFWTVAHATPSAIASDEKPKPVGVTDCDRLGGLPNVVERGVGVLRPRLMDKDKAEAACKAAVQLYPQESRFVFNLGMIAAMGDDPQAIDYLTQAANAGNTLAMAFLGGFLNQGRLVDADPAQSIKWLQKSTDEGNASGMIFLALALSEGTGVPADPVQSSDWMFKSVVAHDQVVAALLEHDGMPPLSEETIKLLQQKLKAEHVYQGAIDGKPSDDLNAALLVLAKR